MDSASSFSLWSAFVASIMWAAIAWLYMSNYAVYHYTHDLLMALLGLSVFLLESAVFVNRIKRAHTCVPTEYANRALYPGGGDDYRTFR